MRLPLIVFIFSIVIGASPAASSSEGLGEFGFADSEAGVRECLATLAWNDEREARFVQLMAGLAAPDYGERQRSVVALIELPTLPRNRMRAAANSGNPDLRSRVAHVLHNNTAERSESVLHRAMTTILSNGYQGFADPALSAMTAIQVEKRTVWSACRNAVVSTAGPEDVPILKSYLKSVSPVARASALAALPKLAGASSVDAVIALGEDPDQRVRLAAAQGLGQIGRRECVSVYLGLLDSPHPRLRFESVRALRKLSGQRFGYLASSDPEDRTEATAAWNGWWDQAGTTASLTFSK